MSDVEVIGVLASDDYVYSKINGESVFVNKQNSLQFLVKAISEMPDSFSQINLFTGFFSDIERYGFVDDYFLDIYQRKQALKEFLKDKLIIFRPYKRVNYDHIKEVRLVSKPLGHRETTKYIPIPIFNQKCHGCSFDDFINKIEMNKYIGKIDYISQEDTPPFVLWAGNDSSDVYKVVGPFEEHSYAHGGYLLKSKSLKTGDFQDDWFNDVVEIPKTETLLFLSLEVADKIEEYLYGLEPCYEGVREAISNNLDTQAKNDYSEKCENEEVCSDNLEIGFIERLIEVTREQGFLYDEKDLVNFHTAMKSSNLVILAGMSGTGKSRLIEFYKKALGLSDSQATIIPVRPSWSDDADLIGYADLLHMVYRPGDSGLINTLSEASKDYNRNRLYIICFDEMNLARVEHYFSQFLSVLEMEPNRRQLRLYNDELEARLYNSEHYRPIIKIGENVMFVGTVNMDESTYHFSDKVLDRANVINLRVRSFEELKDLSDQRKMRQASKDIKEQKALEEPREWSFIEYYDFKNKEDKDNIILKNEEISFLKEVHILLQSFNKNLGVGYRIVRQIDSYLKNLPKTDFLTREEAFDLQVIQRILTKVRGPEDQLKSLLGVVKNDEEVVNSRFIETLDSYSGVSDFKETRKIIYHKARELKIYGYTM